MKSNRIIYIIIIIGYLLSGCKKQDDFLNAKPEQSLAIPLGETSCDDYFVDASYWLSSFDEDRKAYIWAKDITIPNENIPDWSFSYTMVYYANTILTYLPKIQFSSSQQTEYNQVKGSALFFRATAFYNLIQIFAMPYDSTSASKDLGIPLPLTPDLTAKVGRSTQSQCYSQIITDLNSSIDLLPDKPSSKTLPSKAAVYGLLSRIYLEMGSYSRSLIYATECLSLYNQLQDFNKLNPSAFPVYPNFSPEEMFHASLAGSMGDSFESQIDSNLYRSFNDPNDLRLAIYFYDNNGEIEFNSQFDNHNNTPATISTDEIYLTKAECEARLNDIASAMNDLNSLLITRWKTGTYKPYTANSADDAVNIILLERRKELVMTGLRWLDLRRLNKDSRFSITLYRNINGTTYTLPPNDPRYALPIPDNEISLNPIQQNPR